MEGLEPCPLWTLLLRKYALGKLSAVEVQEFASAAWMHLKCKLSRGSMGAIPGNIHRDLQRKYFHKLVAPAPWKITTNMLMKEDGQRVSKTTECHVLLPHSWALSFEEGDLFEKVMCKDNDLVQFWKTQKQNPQMSSDMWRSLDFTKPSQLPVPYVLHGDGAPYTEIDSLQVLSLRMLAFDKHHL